MSPMAPSLWPGFRTVIATALDDWAGTFQLWSYDVAQAIFALNGKNIRVLPTGSYGGPEWLQSIQAQMVEFGNALGLAPPGDLSSYDLADPAGPCLVVLGGEPVRGTGTVSLGVAVTWSQPGAALVRGGEPATAWSSDGA